MIVTRCRVNCVLDGHVQVELDGGSQRHPDTQQFHTGLNYIKASGTPVYNFGIGTLADAAHDEASICADDPQDACEEIACTDVSRSSAAADETTSAMADLPQPVVLRYITRDSLVQIGGLYARSERGRLVVELSEDQEAADMILHLADLARSIEDLNFL